RWFDDGAVDDTAAPVLPAQYCRNCGRSGWAAMRSPESELKLAAADSDANIRREAVRGSSAVRTLILAEAELDEGLIIPVLPTGGDDRNHRCARDAAKWKSAWNSTLHSNS
ncbi:hypothetical protein, partial [Brevibacterium paucivorans]